MRGSRLRTPIVVLLLAVAVAACRSPSPERELREALHDTAATSFAYEVSVEADRAALDLLGDAAADAAGFLADFRIEGLRTDDGTLTASVDIGGTAPLLEIHAVPDGTLLLRTGLPELLGIADRDPAQELLPAMEERGLSPSGQQALIAAFAGEWLEVTDAADAADLFGASPTPRAADDLLAGVAVLGARDAGDGRRFDVEVDLPTLGAQVGLPLQRLGEVAPGVVTVRDGLVSEVVIQLGATDPDTPEQASGIRLVLRLHGHGLQEQPQPPTPAASIARDELALIADQLGVASP